MEEKLFMYGNYKPEPVSVRRELGRRIYTICVFIDYDREREMWKWIELTLPPAAWGYGVIVNAIITVLYASDVMQAIINNYLLDPTDADALSEFNAMQEKRAWAKQTAKELMKYAEEHGLVKLQ